jgi:hypothetical protein
MMDWRRMGGGDEAEIVEEKSEVKDRNTPGVTGEAMQRWNNSRDFLNTQESCFIMWTVIYININYNMPLYNKREGSGFS